MLARDQIIASTCELLELQGYHATGLNEIIKQSGSPKGSLYHYFPGGKEELAAAAVNHVGQIVLTRLSENLALIDDPAEAIATFILHVAHNVELSGYRAGGPITTVALETAATNDVLRTVCHQIYERWQTAFATKLLQGGCDPARAQRLAALIVASIEGGILLCRTSRSRQPLISVAEELQRLIQLG
jgi:TetR/AcrR family transcriptional repressor of lmrAB and yxaGH operons